MNNHTHKPALAHPLAQSAFKNLRDENLESVRAVRRAIGSRFGQDLSDKQQVAIDALRDCVEARGPEITTRSYSYWRNDLLSPQHLPTAAWIVKAFGTWSKAVDALLGDVPMDLAWSGRGHLGSRFAKSECLAAMRAWLATLSVSQRGLDLKLVCDAFPGTVLATPPQSRAYEAWARLQPMDLRFPASVEPIMRTCGGWKVGLRAANCGGTHDPVVRSLLGESLKPRFERREACIEIIRLASREIEWAPIMPEFDAWLEGFIEREELASRRAVLSLYRSRRIASYFPSWTDALIEGGFEAQRPTNVAGIDRASVVAGLRRCSSELRAAPTRRRYGLWRESKPIEEKASIPTEYSVLRIFIDWDDAIAAACGGDA